MHLPSAFVVAIGAGLFAWPVQQPIRPTRVIHFSVPASLPSARVTGACESSRAAWFRKDAARCTSGASSYDPCFHVSSGDAENFRWLCVTDPRKPETAQLLESTAVPVSTGDGSHRAWFFVLSDDSTCTPLAETGREIERLPELYSCRWGADGNADAVLGELDASQPVWTIRKVLINKKVDPQTIKSFTIVPVTTVWE